MRRIVENVYPAAILYLYTQRLEVEVDTIADEPEIVGLASDFAFNRGAPQWVAHLV